MAFFVKVKTFNRDATVIPLVLLIQASAHV